MSTTTVHHCVNGDYQPGSFESCPPCNGVSECSFPGCSGMYHPDWAKHDGFTGWRFGQELEDVPAHDCSAK